MRWVYVCVVVVVVGGAVWVRGCMTLCLIKAGMIRSVESHQLSHEGLSASLVVQVVKNLPAMQETRIQSLGQEDPLENRMATYWYSCLENSMDRGTWWTTVHGVAESDMTEQLKLSLLRHYRT